MNQAYIPGSATVIVIGGEVIVGRALELLLQSTDYNVRFLAKLCLDEPGLLDRVQLLILVPGMSAERRDALLRSVRSVPVGARIPILELVANTTRGAQVGEGHFVVPWPCRVENLKRWIEATLLKSARPKNSVEKAGR